MPTTTTEGTARSVRIFMPEADFKALLDKLEQIGWDHPVRWRIRHKWAEHEHNLVLIEAKDNRKRKERTTRTPK